MTTYGEGKQSKLVVTAIDAIQAIRLKHLKADILRFAMVVERFTKNTK
jgi:hypothetical protein